MEYEKLKTTIENIKDKYSKQQNNISGYIKEIDDEFYEYSAVTGNYAFESVLNDVICGEDCLGLVMGARTDEFYHWKNVDGKPRVTTVDYELYSELVDEALDLTKEYENKKEKDLDIC